MPRLLFLCLLLAATAARGADGPAVEFTSPGFPPTAIDAHGQLLEDWAPVGVTLNGRGLAEGAVEVRPIKLDDVVPAAEATSAQDPVRLTWTAYRAPIHPAGVDVLTLRVEETAGKPAEVTVGLAVPGETRFGLRTLRIGNRVVVTLPAEAIENLELREWGYADEASSLPGWGKPEGKCDAAFRNIRAGMGGVPIAYRFAVAAGAPLNVVLGFCESHWAEAGKRPMVCHVEGAPPQSVEPVGKWGQHKPGALLFAARDASGDGRIDVSVLPAAGAPDRNPILSAIWLFPPGEAPNLEQVIAGRLNAAALRYVDVGGKNDQSVYPPGKLEYKLALAAGESRELTFLLACRGGAAPIPDTSTWTPALLRRAAHDVWRDWR